MARSYMKREGEVRSAVSPEIKIELHALFEKRKDVVRDPKPDMSLYVLNMVVSQIEDPKFRPLNTIILLMGPAQNGIPIRGILYINSV